MQRVCVLSHSLSVFALVVVVVVFVVIPLTFSLLLL